MTTAETVVVGVTVDLTVTTEVGVHPWNVEHLAFSPAKVHTWQLNVVTSWIVEMLVVSLGRLMYAHELPRSAVFVVAGKVEPEHTQYCAVTPLSGSWPKKLQAMKAVVVGDGGVGASEPVMYV